MKKRKHKTAPRLKDNYIIISSWMVNELALKGNQLIIYALIYGFSQAEDQVCTCGVEYMRQWIHGAKSTVIRTINELSEMGIVERVDGEYQDGRSTGYRALRPQIVGSEMRPISIKKGSDLIPNLPQKKVANCSEIGSNLKQIGSKMLPPSDNKYINNNITDLSVSQRACAREDGTDGQTEKEFYAEVFRERLKEFAEAHEDYAYTDIIERLSDIVEQLIRYDTIKVNGLEMSVSEVLKTICDLFREDNASKIFTALSAGYIKGIKKKFNYTVTALYNAAKQF